MAGIADIASTMQLLVRSLGSIGETLTKNETGQPPVYTVATLPAVTASNQGQVAYVTNGRNTGEAAGAGTGCLVTVNKNGIWAAVWSGVAVTS